MSWLSKKLGKISGALKSVPGPVGMVAGVVNAASSKKKKSKPKRRRTFS